MNADPSEIGTDRISSADTARMLGLTEGRVRQLARDGKLGAAKQGRDWTFSRQEVQARATETSNPSAELAASLAAAELENESLRFEREFLSAEAKAQEQALEVTRLQAGIDERDATIAVLNARVTQLERQLAASVAAVSGLAASLLDADTAG